MTERTFAPAVHGLLDHIRDGHPDTPLLVVTPIFCPSVEDHPGPTVPTAAGVFTTVTAPPETHALLASLGTHFTAAGIAYEIHETLKTDAIDGTEDREIPLTRRGETTVHRAEDYLLKQALPNFYFHCTTAYAILRHNGVVVGKRDFIG